MADTPLPPKSPDKGRPNEGSPEEVEAIVNELAEGFSDLLPPDVLEEARAFVLEMLATHPVGMRLAERVRPREVDRSGERLRDGEREELPQGKVGGGTG